MHDNKHYASYMLDWIGRLSIPIAPELCSQLDTIKRFWLDDDAVNLSQTREQLWSWVDRNGGPRVTTDKQMLMARMILCSAYEDNSELQDIGFFEDLLLMSGVTREDIRTTQDRTFTNSNR
jgi:hypothetical protein